MYPHTWSVGSFILIILQVLKVNSFDSKGKQQSMQYWYHLKPIKCFYPAKNNKNNWHKSKQNRIICCVRKAYQKETVPRKLSWSYLRQGNAFTRVCHSVHRGVAGRYQSPSRQTPLLAGKHPPPEGTPLTGRHPLAGRHPPGQTPPSDGHCSGRYASYWNAFLFNAKFNFIIGRLNLK